MSSYLGAADLISPNKPMTIGQMFSAAPSSATPATASAIFTPGAFMDVQTPTGEVTRVFTGGTTAQVVPPTTPSGSGTLAIINQILDAAGQAAQGIFAGYQQYEIGRRAANRPTLPLPQPKTDWKKMVIPIGIGIVGIGLLIWAAKPRK